MRHASVLACLCLLTSCASAPLLVRAVDNQRTDVDAIAKDLASADFVALGELHGTPDVHRTHLALLEAMYARRPDMVIAMEMFERDVQDTMLKYLAGVIDEGTFLAQSRPWKDYARDYRPVVEFAKRNQIVVLAANAPRALAARAAKEGIASVAGEADVARTTTAPEDEYWDAFQEAMKGHPGDGGIEGMKRSYAAQCLKDDTMAESIVDYLQRHATDPAPLAVLICGRMHSDHRRGTVARVLSRLPDLKVRVVSADYSDAEDTALIAAPQGQGDYLVLVPPVAHPVRAERPEPKAEPKTDTPVARAQPPAPGHTGSAGSATVAAGGGGESTDARPALGLMPDYDGSVGGLRVASLREGGPAEAAGVREGDLIVELDGQPIEDVRDYMTALGGLTIGKQAKVKVKRGTETVDLMVTVTARSQ